MAGSQSACASDFRALLNDFEFGTRLSQIELLDVQSTSLFDLQIAITRIQNRQKVSRSTMYLKRLGLFLEATEQFHKGIGLFLDPSKYIATIWGSMKFLLNAASGSNAALNALLKAYWGLGESMPRLVEYLDLFETSPYLQTLLTSVFEDILDFHREALGCFKQRTWEALFSTSWKTLSQLTDYLSKDLRSCKTLLEDRATSVELEEFQSSRTVTRVQLQNLREAELSRRRLSVHQWLSFANAETRQEDAARARQDGTGRWLLQHDRFEKWFNFDYCMEPLLWLNGIPGAGKTVLASLVVEEARELPEARTTFFYCANSDGQRHGFVTVAKSMLAQLASSNEQLSYYLYSKSLASGEAFLSSIVLAKALLETALKTCLKSQKTYVVIDGLDEYSRDDRKEITSWFRSLIESLSTDELGMIRCLFISQDDGYARKDLCNISQVKISPADNRQDIEAYCKSWHEKIEAKFGPLHNSNRDIGSMVTSRAQDMFLLARLIMANLYEQTSRQDLMEELDPDKLPNGLEQAYAKVIEQILGSNIQSERRRNKARKLLGWLAFSKRPLKWYEVQGAVSIDLDEGIVNADLEFKEDCKDLCASLVETNSDGTIVLVHSTAKRYLVEQKYIHPRDVESELAILCLGYLSFNQFAVDLPAFEIQEALLQGYYAFSDYAVCFWPLHLEASLLQLHEEDQELFNELSESIENFLNFHWAYPRKTLAVPKTQAENLVSIKGMPFYDRVAQAIVATKNQLHSRGKGPSEEEILQTSQVINRIRQAMEGIAISLDSTKIGNISQFHGTNWFKCTRLNCRFFSQGFISAAQRDDHISKHERAFMCTVEGCLQAVIGCITRQKLQKHTSESHGIEPEDGDEFPPEEQDDKTNDNGRNLSNHWQCTFCPKKFTRSYNLRSHLRSHTDERPYICIVCQRGFVRLYDLRRHMQIHSGGKRFVCDGAFLGGERRGCGRRFARQDDLSKHSRSDACIDPPIDEQASPYFSRFTSINSSYGSQV